jgi:ribonuclease HI
MGRILHLSSNISPSCTPNVGEARAALLACSTAVSLSYDNFILEGDSEVVVLSLQHPNSVRDWRISSVILDCLDTILPSSSWEVRKVKRSANFCAHSVARWAAAGFHSGSIPISTFPSIISSTACGEDPFPVCFL